MLHSDDGGKLTLFASGDELLIACDQGHFWTLKAKGGQVPSERSLDAFDFPELNKFGPAALQAMRGD